MAAEANYDVGNRELLSIKAALEEWRHWLEGARHPSLVLTDHRNLEYLHGAKRLNPCQARWALFFTHFQFLVTYRPRSKNSKADDLSRQFEAQSEPAQPDHILPAAAILAPGRWSLMEEIRRAHANEPPPANCPATKLRPPRDPPVDTTHSTQVLVAQSRVSRQLPKGLLEPLPTPRRPWSYLSVDFLTDLPDSGGFTMVMVVVDRFLKGCKLIPLKGSPTAMQTAESMFQHVFRELRPARGHCVRPGASVYLLSVGSLCEQLAIGVSLSSGYHPQSNGQTEWLNREIGRFLRSYCSRERQRWSEFLPWAEYAQNSLIHSSTGLTPFQCVLGYQPPLFPWSGEPSDVLAVEEWSRLSQQAQPQVCGSV
ncbi:hypothetical protein QTP86_033611 [Hemibagrus guttatus]|nr:hypothetical protein QTP86_033611 [Hemibagrus guttatus]